MGKGGGEGGEDFCHEGPRMKGPNGREGRGGRGVRAAAEMMADALWVANAGRSLLRPYGRVRYGGQAGWWPALRRCCC